MTLPQATYDLQHLDITGNVIPHQWYNTIKNGNNAPDLIAITILSEIVYWYKPKQIFNERGIPMGIDKKFSGDLLQKSYDDLSEKFGITKRQVREAVVRLEERGLITRHFKNMVVKGIHLSNVLFIELHVNVLVEMTTVSVGGVTKPSTTECSVSSEGSRNQGGTYTKINSKTISKSKDIKTVVEPKAQQPSPIPKIIEYLNTVANKKFKPNTSATTKLINARLSDGYTLQEIKYVIDNKTKEWLNTDMQKYLRPETLFNATKFESYVNEPPYKPKKSQMDAVQDIMKMSFEQREVERIEQERNHAIDRDDTNLLPW